MLFEKIQLESDEQVLSVVRKHWFVICIEFLSIGFLALLPLITLWVIPFIPDTASAQISWDEIVPILFFIYFGWLLFATMAAAMAWTHYYLDLWIITDRRIIVIDQVHFFNRRSSSFRLERLQDVRVSVRGIIATFLNFGTVRAQTASAAESYFKTKGLPDPRGLQATIQSAMDARLKVLNHGPTERDL
jgi:hypothetical protein